MDQVRSELISTDVGAGIPVSDEYETFLSLIAAANLLTRGFAEALRPSGLTPTQFNVLRVLRCAGRPLHCGEMGGRLSSPDPDVTRLLDRLEKRGLIERRRDETDRRVVMTSLTAEGRTLLAELEGPVGRIHREQLSHLGSEKLATLSRLLEEATASVR
jgi:DNA-binding MarR family transcriptional regulator